MISLYRINFLCIIVLTYELPKCIMFCDNRKLINQRQSEFFFFPIFLAKVLAHLTFWSRGPQSPGTQENDFFRKKELFFFEVIMAEKSSASYLLISCIRPVYSESLKTNDTLGHGKRNAGTSVTSLTSLTSPIDLSGNTKTGPPMCFVLSWGNLNNISCDKTILVNTRTKAVC